MKTILIEGHFQTSMTEDEISDSFMNWLASNDDVKFYGILREKGSPIGSEISPIVDPSDPRHVDFDER